LKTCTACNEAQPETAFYKHHMGKDGRRSQCIKCWKARTTAWQKANPDSVAVIRRRTKLYQKYGLTVAQYDAMLHKQRGVCALCKSPPVRRPLDVDHCHSSGVVRGLLCEHCNKAIGLLRDSPQLLRAAAFYLEKPH